MAEQKQLKLGRLPGIKKPRKLQFIFDRAHTDLGKVAEEKTKKSRVKKYRSKLPSLAKVLSRRVQHPAFWNHSHLHWPNRKPTYVPSMEEATKVAREFSRAVLKKVRKTIKEKAKR